MRTVEGSVLQLGRQLFLCQGGAVPTQHSLVLQHVVLWASVVTRTTDISTDPRCTRTTNPDTVSSSNLGPAVSSCHHGPQWQCKVSQIRVGP